MVVDTVLLAVAMFVIFVLWVVEFE